MAGLMQGKRGVVMGVANDHSIAWGIAQALAREGAELAFTYQNAALERRVRPLAESVNASFVLPYDCEEEGALGHVFDTVGKTWGELDFVLHALAFSDKNGLRGLYADTSRENFIRTMLVSCFSFTEMARYAARLMPRGGALLTLTYAGSTRVFPNYNVMGVAKAALESSVRYLAADYGVRNIRVNAISAGPVRTLSGAGITDGRAMYDFHRQHTPLHRSVELVDLGGSGLYFLSDLSSGVTGEVHFVDCGYHCIGMPDPKTL